jgi:hypothetical protein
MTLLDRVSEILDGERISHAMIGAAALAAAGIARSTFDIDLLTADTRVLQSELWEGLRTAGAWIDLRGADEDDLLGGVVRFELGSDRPVDLIVAKHTWQSRASIARERSPAGRLSSRHQISCS